MIDEMPLEIDVAAAVRWQQEGALLLDIREPFELALCQVRGSKHIPMRQIPENVPDLPRDRPILVLCHHGTRSLHVTHFLRAQGFGLATNVAGGINAWSERIDPTLARY